MFFVNAKWSVLVSTLLALFIAAAPVLVLASPKAVRSSRLKLTDEDKRAESLWRAKAQTLALLQEENACSAWFRESDRDPAGVFESLRFQIEQENPSYVLRRLDARGFDLYKQPWVAQSWQFAGRNSMVKFNAQGAFFTDRSPIVELTSGGALSRYLGFRLLTVGPFLGGTPEAQITTLLHELGHVTDRVPADTDSWDGKSVRNTEEVLLHCKSEIHEFAKRGAGDLE